MAFVIISSGEIDVGDPITAALMGKIKGNLDDLNDRVSNIEGAVASVEVFSGTVKSALVFSTLTGFFHYQARADFTLVSAVITAGEIGALTGVLELDIEKSVDMDPANFASVMTTPPSIDYDTASDFDESSNAVFDNVLKDVAEGEWLRFSFTSMPTGGQLPIIGINVYGEV
jgi:hypothetical protein